MDPTRIAAPLLAALAVVAASPALAQCPLAEYTVEGRVLDQAGRPIPGSRVEAEWTERAAGVVSNQREADADGAFSIRIPFDTFSGRTFLGEARCEATLDRVTLRVTSPGYRPRTETVDPATAPRPLLLVLDTD